MKLFILCFTVFRFVLGFRGLAHRPIIRSNGCSLTTHSLAWGFLRWRHANSWSMWRLQQRVEFTPGIYYTSFSNPPSEATENLHQVASPYPPIWHQLAIDSSSSDTVWGLPQRNCSSSATQSKAMSIILKFYRKYCKEAHLSLVLVGLAPKQFARGLSSGG